MNLLAFLCFAALFMPNGAFAEIAVSPLRGVVNPQQTQISFMISNPSQRLVDAKVSLIDLQSTQTGYEIPTLEARQKISAAPWLIVSPVNFTLEPGSRQEVTVTLHTGIALPEFEKRSHLYVETGPSRAKIHRIVFEDVVTNQSASQPTYQNTGQNTGLGLDARLGISVPIILRGANTVSASNAYFKDTKLVRDKKGKLKLDTWLTAKQLSHSLVGTVTITHKPKSKIDFSKITIPIQNISLFTDSLSKKLSIPLVVETLKPGTLSITYTGDHEFYGAILAQKEFEIGN